MKLLLLAYCASYCLAQEQQPIFKTQAPLVVVPVTVITTNGERIWDLGKDDFQVLDNGKERSVTVEPWGTYESHVSLVVVVQTSVLSKAALLKVKKVASMLDGITGEGGEVALISADSDVETRLGFTKTWEDIQETFEKLRPSGGNNGHILDGVDAAITLLAARPAGQRRLILLLSEARDRGSKAKASDVLTRAEQNNVTVYTASYSAYVTPFTMKASEFQTGPIGPMDLLGFFTEIAQAAKTNVASTLAEFTGGRQLSFETLRHLENDLAEIGKEVHSQYQLSFAPEAEETPVYHKLTVTIKHHADLEIRARPGYWNGTK